MNAFYFSSALGNNIVYEPEVFSNPEEGTGNETIHLEIAPINSSQVSTNAHK